MQCHNHDVVNRHSPIDLLSDISENEDQCLVQPSSTNQNIIYLFLCAYINPEYINKFGLV